MVGGVYLYHRGMDPTLYCVVAVDTKLGIGKNRCLPWPALRGDMRRFRQLTTDCAPGKQNMVVMGRRTWLSIPAGCRPLAGRINVVLSRTLETPPPGAHFLASSLDAALGLARSPELAQQIDKVWVIGGGNLYREALTGPWPVRLFLTRVLHDFACDVFLSHDSLAAYARVNPKPGEQERVFQERGIFYMFETYIKVTQSSDTALPDLERPRPATPPFSETS